MGGQEDKPPPAAPRSSYLWTEFLVWTAEAPRSPSWSSTLPALDVQLTGKGGFPHLWRVRGLLLVTHKSAPCLSVHNISAAATKNLGFLLWQHAHLSEIHNLKLGA